MIYGDTITGTFISRPNRFSAVVKIGGSEETCHVKNTGRCRELLVEGAKVVLERSGNVQRATAYDLIAVYKGDMLVNMDSQVPNKVVLESIRDIEGLRDVSNVRPEYKYGNSRIDIYAESGEDRILIEIKGVTLETDGVALFPDAPTERGLKHVRELEGALEQGFRSYIMFLVQMRGVRYFTPNYAMHPEFALEVEKAASKGVRVLAYDCVVDEGSIVLGRPLEVRLGHS